MPSRCDQIWTAYAWLCRVFGILTAIGLWGIGVETTYQREYLGIYLLCSAAVVTFFEMVSVISFWLSVCISDPENKLLNCWRRLLWLDSWKKGIVYALMSVGCFVRPQEAWLALICGGMLVMSAAMYAIKTVADRRERPVKNRAYDRFDVEDAGEARSSNRIVRDSSRLPLPIEQSALDQDDIWEV